VLGIIINFNQKEKKNLKVNLEIDKFLQKISMLVNQDQPIVKKKVQKVFQLLNKLFR